MAYGMSTKQRRSAQRRQAQYRRAKLMKALDFIGEFTKDVTSKELMAKASEFARGTNDPADQSPAAVVMSKLHAAYYSQELKYRVEPKKKAQS